MAGKSKDYPKAQVKSARALGVQEASGLARLGDGSFLVVDDEHGIFRCMPDGSSVQLDAGKGLSDLEGIAVTPDGASAFVLSENDGSIWRFAIDDGDLREGKRLGELPQLSEERNHGWEGIAIAPAGTFAARMLLVAAHQAKPRRVGLFDTETLQQSALLRLPRDAREAIGELNGISVDAGGRILLLSGKSGRIAEMRLEDGSLVTVSVYRIETSKNDVPEGISIDDEGRVWVCSDGEGILCQLELLP